MRQPLSLKNPFIGRLDANDIPPPHDACSLIECICQKEGKGFGIDWESGDAYSTELFKTMSSTKSFDMKEYLSLLTDKRPGWSPREPVILKVSCRGMLNSDISRQCHSK
jgi:hypothetical protein